jgi:hypothetical protein
MISPVCASIRLLTVSQSTKQCVRKSVFERDGIDVT